MRELDLSVRLYFNGEYENTLSVSIEIPDDTPENKEMEVMMAALYIEMANWYDDYEEWANGNISWTLDTWEII